MSRSFCFGCKGEELSNWRLFLISLSSMLGVGIFIKSKTLNELSHFNLWPLLSLFLLAGILIVSMTFVFTKLVDKHSLSGRSFIEWVEQYCGSEFKGWAIRFTRDFAQPIGIITTSTYLINWINGNYILWVWESAIVSFLLGAAVLTLNTFSFKWSEILQRCLSVCIFISMTYVASLGISSIIKEWGGNSAQPPAHGNNHDGLNYLSGWTIMLSGLPSIFFMYDGFYSVLTLKNKAKKQISFYKIILYSMCFVTLLYFGIILIVLMGDKSKGDFFNFYHLKQDKNLRDVLTILIMLTFLSSLNVSTICGQNQLINLHCKYNFPNFERIRRRILNKGKNMGKFSLENRLSSWLFLMKRMMIFALTFASLAQLSYWVLGQSNIFWSLNEAISEINSLFIFWILGVIIWWAKKNESKKLSKFFYYFSSISIFMGSAYYFLNSAISFWMGRNIVNFFKITFILSFIIVPAAPWLHDKLFCRNYTAEKIPIKGFNLVREFDTLKYSHNDHFSNKLFLKSNKHVLPT